VAENWGVNEPSKTRKKLCPRLTAQSRARIGCVISKPKTIYRSRSRNKVTIEGLYLQPRIEAYMTMPQAATEEDTGVSA
jgi:hypothetical protein